MKYYVCFLIGLHGRTLLLRAAERLTTVLAVLIFLAWLACRSS